MIIPFLTPFASACLAQVARIAKLVGNRRAVTQLSHLDDRALKDIGLTRTDVMGALAAPLTHDPSHILSDIAGHDHGALARGRRSGVRRAGVAKTLVIEVTPKTA